MFIFANCVDRNTRIGRRKEVIKRHVEICSCCFHLGWCHCSGSCLAKFERTEEVFMSIIMGLLLSPTDCTVHLVSARASAAFMLLR